MLNKYLTKPLATSIIAVLCFLAACKNVSKPLSASSVDHSTSIIHHPNIVFILIDDMGYEIPTVNGGQSYFTPNLDAFANSGVRFTRCHALPTCAPSRMELLTGKYNFRNYFTNAHIEPDQKTIANLCLLAGYNTGMYGKWQLDGGDVAIRNAGFKQYIALFPYGDDSSGIRYKNPVLYKDGQFLPKSYTTGKYCDDILADGVKDFITTNALRGKPFFAYYAMSLVHSPFCPTPDDPEFAAWNPKKSQQDTIYFPSMVRYADKKIGEILWRIDSLGLSQNTVVIIAGDNGTSTYINSTWNGDEVIGGKGTTVWRGTNVPMFIRWPGVIKPAINNDMISFVDFLPTIGQLINYKVPASFGTIDGLSFFNQLNGGIYHPRDWLYFYWGVLSDRASVWAQTTTRKLYSGGNYYDIEHDSDEIYPLADTTGEAYLQNVIDSLHP